jgi:Molecular chaperone
MRRFYPGKSLIEQELKKSPQDCASNLLTHLKESLIQGLKDIDYSAYQNSCSFEYTITVPASFDDLSKELTHQAAKNAGIENPTLIEEPQAALYSWIEQNEKSWRDKLKAGQLILVCDVGGGTTDFSLIAARDNKGELELQRVGVGKHLLLGGDNMDLALAYHLMQKLKKSGKVIDNRQFQSLINFSCNAKEKLFTDIKIEKVPISIPSKGSKLISSTIKVELTRDELNSIILQGFFPSTKANELPTSQRSLNLQDLGLEYENDPAITKHLAKFLKDCKENIQSDF